MNREKQELFRGHLEECLEHLGVRLPTGSKGAEQARKPMADFCGVGTKAVSRWLYGQNTFPIGLPKGVERLKLMCYLDMLGYRVIDFEHMSKGQKGRRYFAELIGFGVLTTKEATDLLGYASVSTLLNILLGRENASEERDQRMWEAWKERKDALEQKQNELRARYRLDVSPTVIPKAAATVVGTKRSIAPSRRETAVAKIMDGLLTLFEEQPFDQLPAGDLGALFPSKDTVFRLSARLNTLSARLLMSEREEGGD